MERFKILIRFTGYVCHPLLVECVNVNYEIRVKEWIIEANWWKDGYRYPTEPPIEIWAKEDV